MAERFARLQDARHGVLAHVLDGAQPESNLVADRREIHSARIHVWWQHRDTHAAGFVDVFHHFLGVAGFRSEHRGHEFDGVVRFEICGLVSE